jgi:hypothetical protein
VGDIFKFCGLLRKPELYFHPSKSIKEGGGETITPPPCPISSDGPNKTPLTAAAGKAQLVRFLWLSIFIKAFPPLYGLGGQRYSGAHISWHESLPILNTFSKKIQGLVLGLVE